MDIAYVNGQFIHKQQATISIMDRGLLFGESAYEVIPYHEGQPIGLSEHLTRLAYSLERLNIPNPHSIAVWQQQCEQLIKLNQLSEHHLSTLYIQVTRGAASRRQHHYDQSTSPTVIMFCQIIETNPCTQYQQGAKAITLPDLRHQHCHIKSTNLLANVMALHQAQQQGALEAILHRQNVITECTTSNLFIVQNQQLITPPQQDTMLTGVTRNLVINIAQHLNIIVKEQAISLTDLQSAQEVWISSSSKSLIPIIQIDQEIISHGKIGPIGLQLKKHYIQQYSAITTGDT